MKPGLKQWIVGICLGISITTAGYLLLYRTQFSPDALEAKRVGIDPASYVDAKALLAKVRAGEKLSSDDIGRLRQLADDREPTVSMRALSALSHLKGTPDAATAIQIIRPRLTDPLPAMRQDALKEFVKFHTPDAVAVAQQMQNDPDQSVRNFASRKLEQLSAHVGR